MFTGIPTYLCRRRSLGFDSSEKQKNQKNHKRDTIHIETVVSSHSFPFQRSGEPDRAVNCRLSLRENSRRRSQTARREIPRELIPLTPMIAVNWSGRPYQILDTCPYVVSQHMAHFIAVPPYSRSSVRGGEWWGAGAVPGCGSPEARLGVGRPMVTGTARHWYHGDLQIYYVYYACASIYAFRALVHRRKTW